MLDDRRSQLKTTTEKREESGIAGLVAVDRGCNDNTCFPPIELYPDQNINNFRGQQALPQYFH